VIQGATPFPTLLAQSSAHGGLLRYSAGVTSTLIEMPFITSAPAAGGTRFRLRNDSTSVATDVHWTIDASGHSAIESMDCSAIMLAGAQIRVYGARGKFDLEPGATAECIVRWLQSVPGDMRKASLYAWPAFDYLDRNPRNNVASTLGSEMFTDGFE